MFNVPIKFKFYEKLKLYSDFISRKSIFQEKLWDECQTLLAWSSSPAHKHIGSFLDTGRVCLIFGIDKDSFSCINVETDNSKEVVLGRIECNGKYIDWKKDYSEIVNNVEMNGYDVDKVKERIKAHAYLKCEIPKILGENFARKVISKVIDDNLGNVEQAIKNLHAMGFGELDDNRIRINRKGFLMGELILELRKNKLEYVKYESVYNLLKYFIIFLFAFSFFEILIYFGKVISKIFIYFIKQWN